jgi:hypothetical protein
MEPHWATILQRIVQEKSEKEYEDWISKQTKNLQDDRMLHSTFVFTEFFDFNSGLTIRHVDRNLDGKSFAGFVHEFRYPGRIFGGYPHTLRDRDQFSLEVTEHSIRTNCSIWRGSNASSEELLRFPLQSIFDFLLALLLRFGDIGTQRIVKWPDRVEHELAKRGIKYEMYSDHEPNVINLERIDGKFYKEFGEPRIAEYDIVPTPAFETQFANLQVDLRLFNPSGNDRVANFMELHRQWLIQPR